MVFRKNYIYFLVLVTITVWLSVFSIDDKLHIVVCDVGQGDAILIQKQTTQILIDSGPNSRVLDCLGRHMPFFDKTIELAISTHVDKDHSGGFPDVFRTYQIDKFLTNSLDNPLYGTQTVEVLRKVAKNMIFPKKGMVIRIGMIYLDVLHPDSDFKSDKTNDYSITNTLRYGNFKAVFTGDLELNISERLFEEAKIGSVDYIKISHHGSKNGTSEKILDLLKPKTAVISVGKNSYGHPTKEVLDLLEKYNVKILRTDKVGDVVIKTDGNKIFSMY